MIKDFEDKQILILGFAREGRATLNFLKKHFPDKEIGIADQTDGKDYLSKLADYDVIVKSPGIPNLPEIRKAKKAGKIITSATKIFFENFTGKIIGVTGTKGKSTTASLIYQVLKEDNFDVHLAGNIGQPALELLDKLDENSIVVYELSSFQLEDVDRSPHIAVITNIYPEHLDHHESFENYKKAKENIFRYQTKKDFLILNKDGAAAAKIVGKIFKIPQKTINQAIKNFKPLPHRLEFVGQFKGIKFYNDSLATIPQATIRALDILGEDVETLIAGGFDRGIDYSVLGPVIDRSKIKNLILFPTTGEKIWKATSQKIKKFAVDNMKDAVKIAFGKTSKRKIVLLSPASSSFNLFKNYEDRGNQFKKMVMIYK